MAIHRRPAKRLVGWSVKYVRCSRSRPRPDCQRTGSGRGVHRCQIRQGRAAARVQPRRAGIAAPTVSSAPRPPLWLRPSADVAADPRRRRCRNNRGQFPAYWPLTCRRNDRSRPRPDRQRNTGDLSFSAWTVANADGLATPNRARWKLLLALQIGHVPRGALTCHPKPRKTDVQIDKSCAAPETDDPCPQKPAFEQLAPTAFRNVTIKACLLTVPIPCALFHKSPNTVRMHDASTLWFRGLVEDSRGFRDEIVAVRALPMVGCSWTGRLGPSAPSPTR